MISPQRAVDGKGLVTEERYAEYVLYRDVTGFGETEQFKRDAGILLEKQSAKCGTCT